MGKSILDYDPIVKVEREPITKNGKWSFNKLIDAIYDHEKDASVTVFIYGKKPIIHTATQWKALAKSYKELVALKYVITPKATGNHNLYDIFCKN